MSRRHRATKLEIAPDPLYQSLTLAKFINKLMYGGKKAVARAILYDPRWPWHAAAALGGHVRAPDQYLRSQPSQFKDLFEAS